MGLQWFTSLTFGHLAPTSVVMGRTPAFGIIWDTLRAYAYMTALEGNVKL